MAEYKMVDSSGKTVQNGLTDSYLQLNPNIYKDTLAKGFSIVDYSGNNTDPGFSAYRAANSPGGMLTQPGQVSASSAPPTDPGQPQYPNPTNLLTPEGGLKSPYLLNKAPDVQFASNLDDFNKQQSGINLNTQALEELRKRGLSQGPSDQANYLTQQQQLGETNALGQAGASSRQGTSSAFSDLASKGGLSTGARERVAQTGQRQLAGSMQDVRNQGQGARLGILSGDEANKQHILEALPGMENQALDPQFRKTEDWAKLADAESNRQQNLGINNRDYGSKVDYYNIANTLGEVGRQDEAKLNAYSEKMKDYAAQQQSQAIQSNTGAGKK